MKKILVFLGIVILIIILLHLALFIFINTKGKDIILDSVERNSGLKASLESLSIKFPFTIEIKNFKCGEISFRKIDFSLGLFKTITGKLALNKAHIEGLSLKIVKDKKGFRLQINPLEIPIVLETEAQQQLPSSQRESIPSEESLGIKTPEDKNAPQEAIPAKTKQPERDSLPSDFSKKLKIPLRIKKVYIKDASVKYIDLTKKAPFIIIFQDIKAKLRNFSYPDLTKFYIDLVASLKTNWGVAKKSLAISGWIDYLNRNMEVDLNVDSLDYFIFSDYYPPFWKPDNLGIKEARLSLRADINSQNNNLVIDGVLSIDKVEYLKIADGEEQRPQTKMLKTILSLLKADADKPTLNFKIKTKMDSPKLDFSSLESSFKEAVPFAPKIIIQGAVEEFKKGVKDKVKDVKELTVDETVDIFKETGEEIVDTLKSIFVPKKKKEQEPLKAQNQQ